MYSKDKEIISEHIFIFPFSWRENIKLNSSLYSEFRFEEKRFNGLKNWKVKYSKILDDKDYNEFVYFYKPIRSSLYTLEKEPIIVKNYIYDYLDEYNYFKILVKGKEYILNIRDIRLRLYKTGIGMISFEFTNDKYNTIEAMGAINSFSKMIYPPVMPLKKAHEEGFPQSITMKLNDKTYIEERFDSNYYQEVLEISRLIMRILGEPFVSFNSNKTKKGILIEPILGNQMFCCCNCQKSVCADYESSGEIKKEQLEEFMSINKYRSYAGESSYIQNEYSVYGINRYMLLCLTKKWHEARLYNQLVTLVLMQRATLLSLSTEIARISTLPKYKIAGAISSVYEIYVQFINQLYFKEVTEEEEGARIYEELTKIFKIGVELEQLNFEIDEVYEYATLIERSASNMKVQLLTITGAALVIPSFVTGFFGMNIFKDEAAHWWGHREVVLWLNSYVLLPILIVITLCTWNGKKEIKYVLGKLALIVLIIYSFFITIKYGSGL